MLNLVLGGGASGGGGASVPVTNLRIELRASRQLKRLNLYPDRKVLNYFDLIGCTLQFNAFLKQIPTSAQKTDPLPTSLTQIVGLPTMVG